MAHEIKRLIILKGADISSNKKFDGFVLVDDLPSKHKDGTDFISELSKEKMKNKKSHKLIDVNGKMNKEEITYNDETHDLYIWIDNEEHVEIIDYTEYEV